jgi:hypothetical protein
VSIHGGGAGFWRRFAVLFAMGAVGIVSLVPTIVPAVRRQVESMPEIALSVPLMVVLSLISPMVLLAAGVVLGIVLAPRLRLVSLVDERVRTGRPLLPRLRAEAPLALALGVVGGIIVLVGDLAFRPWLGDGFTALVEDRPRDLAMTLTGLLYGGITEELMMRWGVMSLLVWILWRAVARRSGSAPDWAFRAGIVGAALLFGIAHLPAMAAALPLTGALVVRTVALNALGGLVFGWLFWRRSLEAAMISHATFHVVFTLSFYAFG